MIINTIIIQSSRQAEGHTIRLPCQVGPRPSLRKISVVAAKPLESLRVTYQKKGTPATQPLEKVSCVKIFVIRIGCMSRPQQAAQGVVGRWAVEIGLQ